MNKEQFESVTKWQNETFKASTAMSKIAHLGQEYVELVVAVKMKDPQRRLEFADAFILLYGAAAADGMTYEDICKAIDEKMEINRKREWGLPDKNGVINHVREK